jgi:ribosomal protein L1
VSFEDKQIAENVNAVLDAITRSKITKATLASTMGPGVKISLS